jgi:uncharacterized protein
MLTQEFAIETIKSFVTELNNTGLNLKKVFLFGSYARNEQKEYSDIDVALVSDKLIGVGFIDVKKLLPVLRNYILIQPKTYSTKDFYEGDPFLEEIKKEGIEIKMY